MRLLKNGNWKYRNCTVQSTPTETFPKMVTITNAPIALKALRGCKFVNLNKTKTAIETVAAEILINNGAKSVSKQLTSLQMGSEMNY